MTVKPGYKTSEFWFTLVSFIFSGLYLIGLIGENSHKEDLIRDVSHGVESIILIGGQLAILWKYVNSRKEIKTAWSGSTVSNEDQPINDTPQKISKSKPTIKKKTPKRKTPKK